jgi:hypothetical protein
MGKHKKEDCDPGQSRPYLKNNQCKNAKRAGDLTPVVERLPSKYMALSSTPNAAKDK